MRRLLILLLLATAWVVLPGAPSTADAGEWVAPLQPVAVRRAFDPPAARWESGHRGVDLAGSVGQVVTSAGAGEVVFAGPLAGRGVVTVSHGALRTTYEPVSAMVSVGDVVAAGEAIGRLQAGHVSGGVVTDQALLHWGVLRGEDYLDPLSLLGPVRVRLLPRWHLEGPRPPHAAQPPNAARPLNEAPPPDAAPPSRAMSSHTRLGDPPKPKARQGAGTVAALGVVAASGVGALALRRR